MNEPTSEQLGSLTKASGLANHPVGPQSGAGVDGASLRETDGRTRVAATDQAWTDSRLWILQFVVLALYLMRLAATVAFNLDETSVALEFSTFAIFLIPVTYAALNYGIRGAVLTSAWVTLLAVPRFVYYAGAHDYAAAWTELAQVALLDALALLIGQRVSAELDARRLAETAREAHLNAEARYRDLFERNQAPILIVDSSGCVVEANASALRAFGTTRKATVSTLEAVGPQPPATRLVDVIGAEAAGQVLTQLISTRLDDDHDGGDPTSAIERVEPVAFEVEGEPILYRPSATMLGAAEGDHGMQVVFEDVTAETRRHDLMEAYATRVVLGQEEERRHIAQELHDGPVQSLIHLCRQIDEVESQSGQVSDDRLALSDLRVIVEDTVAELRSIAKGLRPSVLDDLGLVASINQLITEAGERQRIETSFGVTGTERRLSPAVELALFRITQEALSNVERHAAARRVAVGMNFEPGGLRLLIKDDGIGFDVSGGSPAAGSQSLGLAGMTERAHLIGARLLIHSESGGGTTVDVWVQATVLDRSRPSDH